MAVPLLSARRFGLRARVQPKHPPIHISSAARSPPSQATLPAVTDFVPRFTARFALCHGTVM